MPAINCPQTNEALTADGDALGYVTVTSNANYYPGARVWMSDNGTVGNKEYIVTDLSGATKVGLREVLDFTDKQKRGPRYGRTPVNQWTVANGSKISQVPTVVRVELSNFTKVPLV
jgi:hypothetical protein